jgi:pimeloyl-ACP methyl ester carboxylesterase
MPHLDINGHPLFVDAGGHGEPVVLVHGSWSSHATWRFVAPLLRRSCHVVTYDRLGHSDSARPAGPYTRKRHEDDLIALIEALGLGPVHLVGNSYGALMALTVAGRRPDLARSVAAHEPPALPPDADPALVADVRRTMAAVIDRLEAGDVEGGARRFFEELALGPGGWEMLPEAFRVLAMGNAATFCEEQRDPTALDLDLDLVAGYPGPVLVSSGQRTLPWFRLGVDAVAEAVPHAGHVVLLGAGHGPHTTHPEAYAELVAGFVAADRAAAA